MLPAVFLTLACTAPPARLAPVPPPADARLNISLPSTAPRAGAAGAPVDCSVEVRNLAEQTARRLVLACELLDESGLPVGSGLGSLENLRGGQNRSLRMVVYGVRNFASARAVVTAAEFQQ
jgi:hypothetical protein